MAAAREVGRHLERAAERLDGTLRSGEAALEDRADVDALVRQRTGAGRQVDAGDLEEADRFGARVDVAAHGVHEARQKRRAQDGEVRGDRLRKAQCMRVGVVVTQRRRVRLCEPEAREGVLDATEQLLFARERAEHHASRRQRERDVVEAEARDLLDDVDLSRDVACAPGRRRDRVFGRSKPRRPSTAYWSRAVSRRR